MFINNFDPVAFQVLSIEIRWYSLSYIGGILIGWILSKKLFISDQSIKEKFDDFITYEKGGCKIFIDSKSFSFLKGSMVDYVDEGLNQGIKFINPNAKAVCGCGESFTL